MLMGKRKSLILMKNIYVRKWFIIFNFIEKCKQTEQWKQNPARNLIITNIVFVDYRKNLSIQYVHFMPSYLNLKVEKIS